MASSVDESRSPDACWWPIDQASTESSLTARYCTRAAWSARICSTGSTRAGPSDCETKRSITVTWAVATGLDHQPRGDQCAVGGDRVGDDDRLLDDHDRRARRPGSAIARVAVDLGEQVGRFVGEEVDRVAADRDDVGRSVDDRRRDRPVGRRRGRARRSGCSARSPRRWWAARQCATAGREQASTRNSTTETVQIPTSVTACTWPGG